MMEHRKSCPISKCLFLKKYAMILGYYMVFQYYVLILWGRDPCESLPASCFRTSWCGPELSVHANRGFQSNNPTANDWLRTHSYQQNILKKTQDMSSRQKTNQKILRTAHSVSFLDVDITASESKPNYPVASLKKPSHT